MMQADGTIDGSHDARTWLGIDAEPTVPFARAVLRGFDAPDLGEAFYAGYQQALAFSFASVGTPETRGSFCVTEAGGGHPRAMACRLARSGAELVLDGEKTFVTGASRATVLWVVAREGERDDGTPKLRVVRVARAGPEAPWPTGVTMTALPRMPFAPTIEHAVVRFGAVSIRPDSVLEGDGYLRFVRPFRTIEDIHVMGSITAQLVAVVRTVGGEEARIEGWLAVLAALGTLAQRAARDATSPALHLALAGALASLRAGVDGLDAVLARHVDPERASALLRDLALVRVAEGARRARRENAWNTLRAGNG